VSKQENESGGDEFEAHYYPKSHGFKINWQNYYSRIFKRDFEMEVLSCSCNLVYEKWVPKSVDLPVLIFGWNYQAVNQTPIHTTIRAINLHTGVAKISEGSEFIIKEDGTCSCLSYT